jgi:threonylcarbamoyladenosine tRNA methylthiotransferase MtaB
LKIKDLYFSVFNFGCRVNAAETNQFSQLLIEQGFTPLSRGDQGGFPPNLIFINTCSVTKKANIESLSKVRVLHRQYPHVPIIISGCADLQKLKNLSNVYIFDNIHKEKLLSFIHSYTPKIKDKYSHTHRYLLKIQSGCNHFCSYCIVPFKRPSLWSLPISDAVKIVNSAVKNGYQEIIITGTNLNLYQPGLSHLLQALLTKTKIPLISFGSLPLNCIDDKFVFLIKNYKLKIKNYLHIPLQSGSDRILKLMHRPYTRKEILSTFAKLKNLFPPCQGGIKGGFVFATDLIIGFPSETDQDFQDTLDLCCQIGFSKIHAFKFSPRPGTQAWNLYQNSPKIHPAIIRSRLSQLKNAIDRS